MICHKNEYAKTLSVIISLAKEVMFSVVFVCLSVCTSMCLSVFLSVCKQHYSKSYKQIAMKSYGGAQGGKINK